MEDNVTITINCEHQWIEVGSIKNHPCYEDRWCHKLGDLSAEACDKYKKGVRIVCANCEEGKDLY